jgi:hypothetical protein
VDGKTIPGAGAAAGSSVSNIQWATMAMPSLEPSSAQFVGPRGGEDGIRQGSVVYLYDPAAVKDPTDLTSNLNMIIIRNLNPIANVDDNL